MPSWTLRELLRARTNFEWVIISTGMFTSFLFEPVFEVMWTLTDTVNMGDLDTSVTLHDAEDIGAPDGGNRLLRASLAQRNLSVGRHCYAYRRVAGL
jgi:hypothetical protein